MKKILSLIVISFVALSAYSQPGEDKVSMELGKGLSVSMNNGTQYFSIGGYTQVYGSYSQIKGLSSEQRFGVHRAFLNFKGKFYNEKLSFFTQFDFTESYPLLDAWIGYHPLKWISISAGQKQAFSGPISMTFDDKQLALADRSDAYYAFFASGRELGVFVETRLPYKTVGADLGIAVTSGDGRNSFGTSSLDIDLGGFKYTARGVVYPLGYFTAGNELSDIDFARETSPKLSVGGTYSYTVGASDKIGEGHGNFFLFDKDGNYAFPDYRKISFDVMFKYLGLTLLAEYTNATGASLNGLYTKKNPNSPLQPREIANYLRLGNSFNFQAGYLMSNNWGIDARMCRIIPEWASNTTLINFTNSYTAGISKFIPDNRLKLQFLVTYTNYDRLTENNKKVWAEIVAHLVF